ncbi:hypothetical protein UlMin_019976 [Ulmus minor]
MYRVAGPSEYLAITGARVRDIKLSKKAFVWPFQKCYRFDVTPVNYTFQVQAMSAEKLPFILPAVFTIGPRVNDTEALLLYAKLLSTHEKESNHVNELVQGIIEGETRVLAASMTMEDIFKGTKEFKREVFEKVQLELNQFGLLIYNANVKQLVDVQGHEYFSYLGQKTQMEAANQAKVDIAEAKKKGNIGAKLREAQTVQNAAEIDSETKIISTQRDGQGKKEEIKVKTELKIFENQRQGDAAESDAALAKKKVMYEKDVQMAKVEAENSVKLEAAKLKKSLEMENFEAQTQTQRTNTLSKAIVDYEIQVQQANTELNKQQRIADADYYMKQKAAEAERAKAEALAYARKQTAESELYAKMKEAEGVKLIAEALKQFEGGNSYGAFRDYSMITNNTLVDIARTNAQAIHGLQPKISIWSQGNGTGGEHEEAVNGGGMKDIAGVYKMLPPLLDTVHEQTGMRPPAWLGSLSDANGARN